MFGPWLNMAMQAAESQQVIALRMWQMALGGKSAREEAALMVSEKVGAGGRAMTRLMMGHVPDSVVSDYRKAVGANAQRLRRKIRTRR